MDDDSAENSQNSYSELQQLVNELQSFKTYNDVKAKYWEEFDSGFAFLKTCHRLLEEILKRNTWLIPRSDSTIRVLNLCGAPGGFCKALLEKNENISIDLYSLPVDQGGHKMLFHHENVTVNALGDGLGDVVQLAVILSRPDEQLARLWRFGGYELVILDGKVLGFGATNSSYQGKNDYSEKDQKRRWKDYDETEERREQVRELKNLYREHNVFIVLLHYYPPEIFPKQKRYLVSN